MTGPTPTARRPSRVWLLLIPLALVELVGSLVVRARVPETDDWRRASEAVAAEWLDGDAITVAPRWADPLLREAMGRALGERFDNAVAGAAGIDGAPRLWVLSIRGHRSALVPADARPESAETYGRVRVERYALGPERVLYDFVEELASATVTRGARTCSPTTGRASGGGLGAGPVLAASRFSCGAETVGETVIEDLHFEGRRCIAHGPTTGEPVEVRFSAVPLGQRLVLYAGLHWVDERHHVEREHEDAPITLHVHAGEAELTAPVHHDGDGWARYEIEVPPALEDTSAELAFTVTATSGGDRPFCWTGVSLGAPR